MMSELLLPHLGHKLSVFPRSVAGTTIVTLDGNQDPTDQELASSCAASVSFHAISFGNFCHPREVHEESCITCLS